jgi:hypothetical protein
MAKMTVEEWKGLFREVGLSDADMKKWHALFEAKHPEAHQSFLEWLGLGTGTIKKVRSC